MDVSHRLAAKLGKSLRERKLILATAESCTGGWVAKVVTAVAGSSEWYDRGYVTYSDAAKSEMLDVSGETIAEHGAVSEPVVRAMAEGAIAKSGAHIAVAISGIAGPLGGTPIKPVGYGVPVLGNGGAGDSQQLNSFRGRPKHGPAAGGNGRDTGAGRTGRGVESGDGRETRPSKITAGNAFGQGRIDQVRWDGHVFPRFSSNNHRVGVSDEPRRRRLFFALRPGVAVRRCFVSLAESLAEPGGRAVPESNIHATLIFLGSVNGAGLACAQAAASRVRIGEFSLVFEHLGYWRKPQVVWSAPKLMPQKLMRLAGELRRDLQTCDIEFDQRPYRCHVTLRRKAGNRPAHTDHAPLGWRVREFCLMQSRTLAAGPVYEVVGRWPLRGD